MKQIRERKNRLLAILLAGALVFALAGCSELRDTVDKVSEEAKDLLGDKLGGEKKEDLAGTWVCRLDLSDKINENMEAELGDAAEYLRAEDLTVQLELELREDGTYLLEFDKESFYAAVDRYAESMKDGVTRYLEDMLAEAGLDMTVEDLLQQSGMSVDDLVDEIRSELANMDMDELDEARTEGCYKVEEGRIYLSEDTGEEPDESNYIEYELSDGVLMVTGESGEVGEMASMLPLRFERQ